MNTVSGTPVVCCSNEDVTHDDITSNTITNSGLITTLDLKATNNIDTATLTATTGTVTNITTGDISNTNTISTDIVDSKQTISRKPQFKTFDGIIYPNFHSGYNTTNNLFYVFAPTANAWRDPQDTLSLTINKINNADIVVGSRWKLRMGLQINDLQVASPNIVDFRIRIGNSGYTPVLFSTQPPKNQSPIIISIDSEMVCTAKTTVAPFEYTFVINANYIENNDNGAVQIVQNISGNFTGLSFLSGIDSPIAYQYYINGSNVSTVYNRGLYSLYKLT